MADPGKGHSIAEQALTTKTISDQVLTPFDWTQNIQLIKNPIFEKSRRKFEHISVDLVYVNVNNKVQDKKVQEVDRLHKCPNC